MNDRIKHLEKQCWGHRVNGTLIDGHLHFDTNKFAELIIQDCIDILAGYRGKVTWLNEDEMHQHPIYVIQKHFGIKE
jgi:hypothetical protein